MSGQSKSKSKWKGWDVEKLWKVMKSDYLFQGSKRWKLKINISKTVQSLKWQNMIKNMIKKEIIGIIVI